jgi:hypothetical protein
MISITTILRRLAGLKEDIEEFKKRKEKEPGHAEPLIKDRADSLKEKAQDKPITRPSLFMRDIGRIISYIEKEIKDPTRQGLKQLFTDLSNQVSFEKGYTLTKGKQLEILDSASKIKDSGTLLQSISNLFNEVYEGVRRAPVHAFIRRLAELVNAIQQ